MFLFEMGCRVRVRVPASQFAALIKADSFSEHDAHRYFNGLISMAWPKRGYVLAGNVEGRPFLFDGFGLRPRRVYLFSRSFLVHGGLAQEARVWLPWHPA